ncbi:MAG: PEGA domain-containing protein, partial [Vicinamibacterales bacterium]
PEHNAALLAELEALVAANIHHSNIAAPIASGLEHGAVYLAQEYAVGDSLDVVLRERGPMPVADVVALVESLARAIDYAAERGVRHGSLHPRDIVLAPDAARVSGFGIAAALSKIGATLPTRPQYASDVPSDVYSLGAIAFEAATGKRASVDNFKELEAALGTELRNAFALPLAVNPEMRPKRARDFAAALRSAAGLGATGAISATGAQPALNAPIVPQAPIAPNAPADPLDPVIDLGVPQNLELDTPSDFNVGPAPSNPRAVFPSAWVPQPSRVFATEVEPEPSSSRWAIVAMFLVFAVLATLSVGLFLRAPRPTPATEQEAGVAATIVDLPASAPTSPNATAGGPAGVPTSPNATAGRPAGAAPNAPAAPHASIAPIAPMTRSPAPTPSRPASGAVRGAHTGSVLVRSTPADADVLVNGTPRGKTPLALRDLALGSYTIRVVRDGYATEERTLQLTVRRPSTSTTINLRSTSARGAIAAKEGASADRPADKTGRGGLNVQSRPAGARVFVNNQLVGSTPIAIPGLPAGPATVRIELDGYQPWTTTVRVSAGDLMRVAASLESK